MNIGQKIAWLRYGKPFSGTVIRIRRCPWAMGASTIVAVDDTDLAHLHEFTMHMGYSIVDATEPVSEARARYINALRKGSNWVKLMDEGFNPTEDWGTWNGLGNFEPAR